MTPSCITSASPSPCQHWLNTHCRRHSNGLRSLRTRTAQNMSQPYFLLAAFSSLLAFTGKSKVPISYWLTVKMLMVGSTALMWRGDVNILSHCTNLTFGPPLEEHFSDQTSERFNSIPLIYVKGRSTFVELKLFSPFVNQQAHAVQAICNLFLVVSKNALSYHFDKPYCFAALNFLHELTSSQLCWGLGLYSHGQVLLPAIICRFLLRVVNAACTQWGWFAYRLFTLRSYTLQGNFPQRLMNVVYLHFTKNTQPCARTPPTPQKQHFSLHIGLYLDMVRAVRQCILIPQVFSKSGSWFVFLKGPS